MQEKNNIWQSLTSIHDKNIKVGTQGTYINLIKDICGKPTANIILNDKNLKAFLLNSRRR